MAARRSVRPPAGRPRRWLRLSDLPEVHAISTFTEAGLLSGSPTREGGTATGGFLRQIGDSVASSWPPTSGPCSTSTARPGTGLFACLREVFDGRLDPATRYRRGQELRHGKVTPASSAPAPRRWTRPSVDLGLLGERFSYYRMPAVTPADEYMACVVADENAGRQPEIRAERARAVAAFFDGLVIPEELPPMTEDEQARLVTLAGSARGAARRSSATATPGRSSWSRDMSGRHDSRPAPPAPCRPGRHRRTSGGDVATAGQGGTRRGAPRPARGARLPRGPPRRTCHLGHRRALPADRDPDPATPSGPQRSRGARSQRLQAHSVGHLGLAEGELVGSHRSDARQGKVMVGWMPL